MPKTTADIASEIRGQLAKGKLKAARKSLEKARKSSKRDGEFRQVEVELHLAEGGGESAAQAMRSACKAAPALREPIFELAQAHLSEMPEDDAVRDVLWELALAQGRTDEACFHLTTLLEAAAIDAGKRGRDLLARKDVTGGAGIFLLASLGGLKTDRLKLADMLMQSERGRVLLGGCARALFDTGVQDGPVHYALARLAQAGADRETFLDHAEKALRASPDAIWTWMVDSLGTTDRLEIALRHDSLPHLLQAAAAAEPDILVAVGERVSGETSCARTLHALGLLLSGDTAAACAELEAVVQAEPESSEEVAGLLEEKAGVWPDARVAASTVVARASADRPERVSYAANGLLAVPEERRGAAWREAAARLLEAAPERDDLRAELGASHLAAGESERAAALLNDLAHLAIAQGWVARVGPDAAVLRAAAETAQRGDAAGEHAQWILDAARADAALLSEVGALLGGGTLPVETLLESAAALLDKGSTEDAAALLLQVPLEQKAAAEVRTFLKERGLSTEKSLARVLFRCALAEGDLPGARRLFPKARPSLEALASEAIPHDEAARALAELLVELERGDLVAPLLEARRQAGDDARALLHIAAGLVRKEPDLAAGRLVRARLSASLGRTEQAVADLRKIAVDAPEAGAAFDLLGALAKGETECAAHLGRADLELARRNAHGAIAELASSGAPPEELLDRYERICRDRPDLDAGHRGRAQTLLALGRTNDAIEAHFFRFTCGDADSAAVASDLLAVAKEALAKEELDCAVGILERLPEHVRDGAARVIALLGDDKRAPILILRSQMLLRLGRATDAVEALSTLVAADPTSRPQAAKALAGIIESGRARPEADLALASAYAAMARMNSALETLRRLYDAGVTRPETVRDAAVGLVHRGDDPDVRLFLASLCLDQKDPSGATEHAVHARRLRPEARRAVVSVLQRALDLDAFRADTHFALGEAHLAGDEIDDAVRHFRAAVEVDGSRAQPAIHAMEEGAQRSKHAAMLWLAVGTTHAEFTGDHAAAVNAFTHALESDPPTELLVPILLGRGDSYIALRKDDEAFDDFDAAAQRDLLERRYYEFLRTRHRKRVLEAAEAAEAKAGEDFAAAADACGRFLRLGRVDQAVSVAQRALAAAPGDLAARYLVGVCLHAAGRYDAAAQALEAVRAVAGADNEVGRAARMLLAESYLDKGERELARACLTEIEAVDAAYPGLKARRSALAPPADDPHAPPPLFLRPNFPH